MEGTTVETQSHSDGLSGVVRSSLDLVCPPPTGDEGATFQLGREEQRHTTAQCVISSDGEEGRQEPDDGGKVEVGQEGERGTVCEDMTSVTKEPTGEGNTETSGGGRDKETKKTRSRKVSVSKHSQHMQYKMALPYCRAKCLYMQSIRIHISGPLLSS